MCAEHVHVHRLRFDCDFRSLPPSSARRYRAHWRFAVEQLVFLGAFTYWLETHELITVNETSKLIGGKQHLHARRE